MMTHDNAKAMYSTYISLKKSLEEIELQTEKILPGKAVETHDTGRANQRNNRKA